MQRARLALTLLPATLAAAVLVGWYAHVPLLTTVAPGYVSMKPNTAVCLLLLSVGLTVLNSGTHWHRPAVAAISLVGLLAATTAGEIFSGYNLHIDLLLPGVDLHGQSPRMSPATAVALLLLAIAALAGRAGRLRVRRVTAIAAFMTGYIAVLGYLYSVSSLYTIRGYTSMALHTALSISVLAVALLLADPERGLVGLLRGSGNAGRLVRGLLPFLLLGPALLGWLQLRGQDAGWYDTSFGVAILVASMTVSAIALLWRTASHLDVSDRSRDAAHDQLRELNAELEELVQERTKALAETNDDLQTVFRLAPVAIVRLDAQGLFVGSNERWETLSGLTREQAVGTGWAQAVHPDDRERIVEQWQRAVTTGAPFVQSLRFLHPDGHITWAQAQADPFVRDGRVTGYLGIVTDVSGIRLAEQATRDAQAQFEAVFASSPMGSALTSTTGLIQEVNRLLPELTEQTRDALLGLPIDTLFEEITAGAEEELRTTLLQGDLVSSQFERTLRRPGTPCFVQVNVSVVHDGDGVRGLVYQLEDITTRRLAENRAAHMALHDSLTDLPNRLLLLDRLHQALQQAARSGRGVGVLFIDLDRFKIVNDSLGHHAGDLVLTEVARRLRHCTRASDTVARLGGDEFVVVCPDIGNERDMLELAATVRTAVARPIPVGEATAQVDASIGIAFGLGHDDPETLLRNADSAMYRAKEGGRARHELFDDDLRTRLNQRLDTELALRGATERDEIEAWFQPIIDLTTGAVAAPEALCRWRRPDLGVVMPVDFIRVAEEAGLIKEIGRTVLYQACFAAAALPDGSAVSVNVSAKQFVRDDFQAVVEQALLASGLEPQRLWLELTESVVVEAIDSAARSFQALRDKGIRLAIDDFGTGFSSFAHLRQFPVDLVKIDMTFVKDLERSPRDRSIVQGIVRMADALQLDVVAEGIETTGQRDLVRRMGCRYAQGFLFAAPSPIVDPQLATQLDGLPRPRRAVAPSGPRSDQPRIH